MEQTNEIFTVGFGRTNITPKMNGLPLAGYGATHLRLSDHVIDDLYAHMICLGHGDKPEYLLITLDLIAIHDEDLKVWRKNVSETTGIPEGQILIGGTHTHSAPDMGQQMPVIHEYTDYITECLKDEAPNAVRDLKPAKIFYGAAEVGRPGVRMNFCRHYKIAPNSAANTVTEGVIEYCGDNFNNFHAADKQNYHYVGHAQDVDPMLQVIKFVREDADDIIMVNFQAHAHITGGGKKTGISSDFPGTTIKRVEEIIPGTKCVYYNGACGNINPNSRMDSDSIPGLTIGPNRSQYGYGAVLADYVRRINLQLRESVSTVIDFRKRTVTCENDHSMDARVEDARIVRENFLNNGWSDELREMLKKYDFNSPYQCGAIIAKAGREKTSDIEINALRIGDVGYASCRGEFFSDLGVYIKKNSPFKMTFFKGYSCGSGTYFPSVGSPMDSYERNVTRFVPGTGEMLSRTLVEMLTEMYN